MSLWVRNIINIQMDIPNPEDEEYVQNSYNYKENCRVLQNKSKTSL